MEPTHFSCIEGKIQIFRFFKTVQDKLHSLLYSYHLHHLYTTEDEKPLALMYGPGLLDLFGGFLFTYRKERRHSLIIVGYIIFIYSIY